MVTCNVTVAPLVGSQILGRDIIDYQVHVDGNMLLNIKIWLPLCCPTHVEYRGFWLSENEIIKYTLFSLSLFIGTLWNSSHGKWAARMCPSEGSSGRTVMHAAVWSLTIKHPFGFQFSLQFCVTLGSSSLSSCFHPSLHVSNWIPLTVIPRHRVARWMCRCISNFNGLCQITF